MPPGAEPAVKQMWTKGAKQHTHHKPLTGSVVDAL